MSQEPEVPRMGWGGTFRYAVGDAVASITLNGMNNFAMIYLTQILGLSAAWASLAISVAIFWDAVTDPVMGHVSDNTRTRWGRRHPFILVGGLLSAISFILFWTVPQILGQAGVAFSAALVINLMIRTALTVYMVPYTALGFEICPNYEDRSRVQGVRFFINQVTNFVFGSLAMTLFFQSQVMEDGTVLDGNLVSSNYVRLGLVYAGFIALLVSICVAGTWQFAKDNRSQAVEGNSVRAFFADFSSIFKDRLALCVFAFFIVAQLAMMFMAQTQMFTYIFFMKFSGVEKSLVHGAGTLSFAFCSLGLSGLVKRLDKKPAGYLGMALAMFGGLGLFVVFTGGLMAPQQGAFMLAGQQFHISTLVFALLQMCWWGGCGLIVPLASSMIADVAAINEKKTGKVKNASYAAVFTFCIKAAGTFGIVICGALIAASGIVSGAKEQTLEASRNIAMMTFLCGPAVMVLAMVLLHFYPVSRKNLNEMMGAETNETE